MLGIIMKDILWNPVAGLNLLPENACLSDDMRLFQCPDSRRKKLPLQPPDGELTKEFSDYESLAPVANPSGPGSVILQKKHRTTEMQSHWV